MTMTTRYNVLCDCGHKGTVILRENDTPYSSSFWESYRLENLNGREIKSLDKSSWESIFKSMNISCPKFT